MGECQYLTTGIYCQVCGYDCTCSAQKLSQVGQMTSRALERSHCLDTTTFSEARSLPARHGFGRCHGKYILVADHAEVLIMSVNIFHGFTMLHLH